MHGGPCQRTGAAGSPMEDRGTSDQVGLLAGALLGSQSSVAAVVVRVAQAAQAVQHLEGEREQARWRKMRTAGDC